MEVTSQSPLVRDVADAIKRKHKQSFEEQAKAALDACHAEEMREALKKCLLVFGRREHVQIEPGIGP